MGSASRTREGHACAVRQNTGRLIGLERVMMGQQNGRDAPARRIKRSLLDMKKKLEMHL